MNEERIIFISTHQTRDLENLIDQVIIVDNGELLLNAPVESINQELALQIVKEDDPAIPVIYEEEAVQGRAVITPNTTGIEPGSASSNCPVAATENPAMVRFIFNN